MEATSAASSASSVDGRSVGGSSDYLNLGMFTSGGTGQQQQSNDLLVGAGSGFSLGNGFGADSTGATTSGTSFDLSDFPSLGGTAGSAAASGNGLAAALRQQQQQQQLLAHQQMLQGTASKTSNLYRLAMTGTNGNFNMASEDFPALSSGAPGANGPATGSSVLNASSLLSGSGATSLISRTSSGGSGLYGNELESGSSQLEGVTGLLGGTGLGGLGALRGLQQSSAAPNPSLSRGPSGSAPSAGAIGSSSGSGGASGSAAGSALNGDYGLLGLLGVIRMSDANRNALALGSDLTLMGLNLGTTEQVYSTFSGPWSDGAASKEPHYQVRFIGMPPVLHLYVVPF